MKTVVLQSIAGLSTARFVPIVLSAMANRIEAAVFRADLPVAPDRRGQDRALTRLPIRIQGIDEKPVYYSAICTNLGRGRTGIRNHRAY